MKAFTYKNTYCDLSFEPDKLQGKDVYNVSVNGEHAIYMTKELVEALHVKNKNGVASIDNIKKDLTLNNFIGKEPTLPGDEDLPGIDKWRGNVMSQYILLDLPRNGEINYSEFYLTPTIYRKNTSEVVIIRPTFSYLISNSKRDLLLKVKDNDLEAYNIFIKNTNKKSKTTIELNLLDNIVGNINIKGLQGHENDPAYFYFETKNKVDHEIQVEVNNLTLPYTLPDQKRGKEPSYVTFFGSDFVAENVKFIDNFKIVHNDCFLKSEGIIYLKNSDISISSGAGFVIGIDAKEKINMEYCNLDLRGLTSIGEQLSINGMKGNLLKATLSSTSIDGSLRYRVADNLQKSEIFLMHANISVGKGNCVRLYEDVSIRNTKIENTSDLSLRNVALEAVTAKNISNLNLVNIYYANFENFSLENNNYDDKINFNIGSPRQDREKIKHFKNCTVTLKEGESFDMVSSYSFEANNSSFEGTTMIKLMPAFLMPFGEAEPDMSLKVNNSLFSNACVSLTYSSKEPQESVIESSEIKNHLRAKDLFSVSTAFLDEVQLANVSKINTLSLQNYINVDNPSPIVLDGSASTSEEIKKPNASIITTDIEVL
jgi:hypothetical protein